MSSVPLRKSAGQSLLEVTIVIGLVVIVLMAMSSVVIHGLETSQVAQSQAQATKLASEGLDIVRNIRDAGGTICNYTPYRWDSTFWGSACTRMGPCYFQIRPLSSGTCSSDSSTTDPWLEKVSSNAVANRETIVGTQFTRLIQFDTGASDQQVKVTSTVFWTDYSGEHSTSQVTILANI